MRSLHWLMIPLLLPASPALLSAQQPALRTHLVALRDSTSTIALFADAQTRAAAEQAQVQQHQADASLLLQAGLVQLRAGELSPGRAALDRAQALFDEAIYRAPEDWPWPWYGLALTDLALDSSGAVVKSSMHSGAGVYYHDAALHALGQALDADSSFVPAAALLGDILLPFGERGLNGELKRAVRRAAATNQVPTPWLALGRVYRNLHEPDSAVAAFRQYVALGGDSALGLLEQARSLYDLGQVSAATTSYLEGARIADSLAREQYRRDLAWVATPDELAAFDAAPLDSMGAFVAAFWAKRDAEELRAPGERLAEHVRRWRYVFEHFQVSARAEGTPQRGGANCGPGIIPSLRDDPEQTSAPDLQLLEPGVYAATWRGKRQVDDRGLIYMRHGAPDERAAAAQERALSTAPLPGKRVTEATPAQTETRPNESWKYVTPHGTLLFHFCGSLALGTSAATTLVAMLPLNPEMIGARAGLDPRFAALEGELRTTDPASQRSKILSGTTSGVAQSLVQQLVRDGKRDIAVGLSSDEFPVNYAKRIEVLAQFYAVGQPADRTGRVLAVFALAGDQLTPTPLPQGGVVYSLALRFIATDAAAHIIRQDTTRYFRAADTLRQGQYLYGTEEMPLGAGTWDVRLLVTQPDVDAGGALERRAVMLAPGSQLGLSDLVFGREGSGLAWHSPAGDVPLSPLDAYPRSGSVEVYYELSGATTGREYQTQLELKGIAGDAKGEVRLGFSEKATGPMMRLRRSVALDPLKGGQYRMTMTVTEEGSGKSVTRSRLLNVIR